MPSKKSDHHVPAVPTKHRRHKKHLWKPKDPAKIPKTSLQALKLAMGLEQVPMGEFDDLAWIMAQESEGIVNARNPQSTARGLYQLLDGQYHYNPHDEKSFGNAVEECQGGLRYIKARYGSAASARRHWEKNYSY